MSPSRRGRRMMAAVSSLLVLALVAAMPHPAAAEAPPAPSVDPATPLEDLKLLLLPLTEAQLATGVTGTVREMSLVSTTLVTGDNQLIVVPNSNVWGSMITNINASPTRRVDLTFSIGYDDDEELARRILEEIVASHALVLKEPEWVIRLHRLGDSSVDFICRPWVRTSDYRTVYWDITQQVKDRFDDVGVSIPFPQRDIHVYTHGKPEPEFVSG